MIHIAIEETFVVVSTKTEEIYYSLVQAQRLHDRLKQAIVQIEQGVVPIRTINR